MKKLIILTTIIAICCSCATGPVRYHTLGKYNYLTGDMVENHGGVAAPLGVILDAMISTGDTVSVAIVSVPTSLNYISKDGARVPWNEKTSTFESIPIFAVNLLLFPITYPINLYKNSYGIERDESLYWGTERCESIAQSSTITPTND